MTLGNPLVGLSLLLPCSLALTIVLARNVAVSARRAPTGAQTWLAATAAGYLVYLVAGVAGTELLSAFDAIGRVELVAWWVGYAVVVGALGIWYRPSRRRRQKSSGRPGWLSIAAASIFGVLAAFLFWLGAATAPNDPDAMLYHLVRAANWASNGNVNNFATYVTFQLYYGRLAEYFVTQSIVLDGNDHLAFIPEWTAYVVSVVMVTGLARLLSGRRSAAFIGLLLAATLPLGVMQATDTQNDMVVGSTVLATFYIAAILWRRRRPDPLLLLLLGIGSGIALLTKIDAALAVIPLAIALAVMAWRDHWKVRVSVQWGVALVLVIIVVTAPMTVRNWETFHNVLGQSGSQDLSVSTADPGSLALNGVRNLLTDADTLRPSLNEDILRFVMSVGRPFGLDGPSPYTDLGPWPNLGGTPTEDGSGSLVALAAVILAVIALANRSVRRRLRLHELVPVFAASLLGLVLIVVVLRWQPWGARLELITLLPAMACAAAVVSALPRRTFIGVTCVLVVASLVMLPLALFMNDDKPIIGRDYLGLTRNEQMFNWCPGTQRPMAAAVKAEIDDGQHEIGYISLNFAGDIYPIWALLSQQAHGAPVKVIPVGIDDDTGKDTRSPADEPRVVLVLGSTRKNVAVLAQPLGPKGYRLVSMTPATCQMVGTYVRR